MPLELQEGGGGATQELRPPSPSIFSNNKTNEVPPYNWNIVSCMRLYKGIQGYTRVPTELSPNRFEGGTAPEQTKTNEPRTIIKIIPKNVFKIVAENMPCRWNSRRKGGRNPRVATPIPLYFF